MFKKRHDNNTATSTEAIKPDIPAPVANSGITPEPTTPIKLVKLKNGQEVPEAMVNPIMKNADLLFHTDPIAFYELVQKCRNSSYTMYKPAEERANRLVPITNGTCHIINSAVEGNGWEMSLGSPFPNNRP